MASTPDERKVNTLRLFFFQTSGNNNDAGITGGSGLYAGSQQITDIEAASSNISDAGTFIVQAKVPKGIQPTRPYTVLAVANAPKALYDASDDVFTGYSEERFSKENIYISEDSNDETSPAYDKRPIRSDNLLMSCRSLIDPIVEQTEATLRRVPCRIDVHNRVATYKLVSASVWNAAGMTNIWGETENKETDTHTNRYYGVKADDSQNITSTLYTSGNFVRTPDMKDKVTTCLIIGMSNIDTPEEVLYYRVNLVNDGMQYLKRNTLYQLNITGVKPGGSESEESAITQQKPLLELDQSYWNQDELGTIHSDNEGNILAVGKSGVQFYQKVSSDTINIIAIGKTPGITLQMDDTYLPKGMKATLDRNGTTGSDTYLYTLIVKAEKNEQDRRKGHINLLFGTLEGTIVVTQNGKDEHYLEVYPTTLPLLESTKGATSKEMTVSSSGEWTAQILGNGFAFSNNSNTTSGKDGDKVQVHTVKANTSNRQITSFIVFQLKDAPQVDEELSVIQKPAGSISLNPSYTLIEFSPDGKEIISPKDFNGTFTVTIGAGTFQEWEIDDDRQKEFLIDNRKGTGNGSFTLTASNNISTSDITRTIRVQLKGYKETFQELTVTQKKHSITLTDPEAGTLVPVSGGTRNVIVKATSNWKFKIEENTHKATVQYTTNGILVTFPKEELSTSRPTVRLKVYIDGMEEIYQQITIQQEINAL
jgi:hypothetical protein